MGRGKRKISKSGAYRVPGIGTNTLYQMHDDSTHNLVKGLLTRVFFTKYKPATLDCLDREILDLRTKGDLTARYVQLCAFKTLSRKTGMGPPIPPAREAFGGWLKTFRNKVIKRCPKLTPIDKEKFASYYEGQKRKIYENARKSLNRLDVEEKDSFITAFMKKEKLNFTAKTDPDPRVIQPCHPRYNAELGRFIKPMESVLCKGVAKVFKHPTITKGMNVDEVGRVLREKWEMFANPVAVGLDAARFDQHVGVVALEFEHFFYSALMKNKEDRVFLEKMLKWQLKTTGFAYTRDSKITFEIEGGRKSGHPNTGLGNCLISCAMIWAYAKEKDIKVALANNGDDCVVFMDKKDLSTFTRSAYEWFYRRGFTMEIEKPVFQFEQVVFCQSQPVNTGSGYRMVRDPRTSMSKDAVCMVPVQNENAYGAWLTAVGECGLALAGDMPVLNAYYNCLYRNGKRMCPLGSKINKHPVMDTGMARMAWGLHPRFAEPNPDARASFYWAFGVLPDAQVDFERYYNSLRLDYNPGIEVDGKRSLYFNTHSAMGLLC